MTNETDHDTSISKELFFRLSGTGKGIWETNRSQPTTVQLVDQKRFHGEVLDIGCGIADNAIYIASHVNNINLTAIDLVPRAVEVAGEKAQKENVNIQFEVVNMLDDLSKTNLKHHSYDVLLDSAIFHAFSNDERLVYIKNLEYLIKPNGLYIQIVYSEKETRDTIPRRVKKSDLIELFSSQHGWTIESIEDTVYESRPDSPLAPSVQAYLSLIRRTHQI
ncbi:unnamed protein product [Rotaria socialis]|uniref:Methyltransferase domain-containing protein n=2 Tax=Rotaria socialis TaxID=392032 RepID=A0A818ZYW6_9BILA|nr:unnamed protein product [Rotaria socialis]CAF3413797.1 unnamed protein product [Rotaria socialis]CAF3775725.1 unnamed protein product [Rotaria socialis]CAF4112033.1 unnamed protein product [Rotaria socialis]CAF4416966.1 unnamed protein product [Rotaria socialis]